MAETTGARVVSARVHVLASWVVSHIAAVVALVVTPATGESVVQSMSTYAHRLGVRTTFMDGGWYRLIVDRGFPEGPLPTYSNQWPFFPLYPWLADAVKWVGLGTGPSLIMVSWIAALVALAGVWRLAESRFGTSVAMWSVWLFAFAPGAIGLTMAYSDGIFVAGVVWALVWADRIMDSPSTAGFDRRFVSLGLCCAVATMSRPNGFLVVVAMTVVAFGARHRLLPLVATVAPSAVFLAGWMLYARHMTGDALAFLSSKETWLETTIIDFVRDPFERPAIVFHVAVFIVTVAVTWSVVRRMPTHWWLVAGLLVVPSFVLGVEGLARYTFMAAPLSIALAVRAADRDVVVRWSLLVVSTTALLFLCANVVRYTWVP